MAAGFKIGLLRGGCCDLDQAIKKERGERKRKKTKNEGEEITQHMICEIIRRLLLWA